MFPSCRLSLSSVKDLGWVRSLGLLSVSGSGVDEGSTVLGYSLSVQGFRLDSRSVVLGLGIFDRLAGVCLRVRRLAGRRLRTCNRSFGRGRGVFLQQVVDLARVELSTGCIVVLNVFHAPDSWVLFCKNSGKALCKGYITVVLIDLNSTSP